MARSDSEIMERICDCWSGRIGVEHTVDGAGRVVGVQGAKDQVPGFRGRDGQRDGLKVA